MVGIIRWKMRYYINDRTEEEANITAIHKKIVRWTYVDEILDISIWNSVRVNAEYWLYCEIHEAIISQVIAQTGEDNNCITITHLNMQAKYRIIAKKQ